MSRPDSSPSPVTIPPVLLLGGGRMGSAMMHGWQQQGLSPSLVIDPAPIEVPAPHRRLPSADLIPAGFQPAVIVLAVKPQLCEAAIPPLAHLAGPGTVVLSIMAGRTTDGLRRLLPPRTPIVRAMPNTPAAIGRGVTVAYRRAGPDAVVNPEQEALCDRLLRAIGAVAWVEDEALLDAVTAISGSGPAYVFLLAELLEEIGREHGLPADLARLLARGTVSGSGALLDSEAAVSAAELRRAVTSPGGTTEQALAVLMAQEAWPSSLRQAVRAAAERSRALAR